MVSSVLSLRARLCNASALALAGLVLAGCGGGDKSPPASSSKSSASSKPAAATTPAEDPSTPAAAPSTPEPAPSTPTPPPAAGGTGTLTGVIKLDGMAPELPPLVMEGDSSVKDADVCAMSTVPNESVVVGEDGGLANVFVYLGKAPKGADIADPEGEVVFDQKGCVFQPHCLTVRTGQTVRLLNSDGVPHNVHTKPVRNSALNSTLQPNDATGIDLKYERIEQVPVQVVCDIHTWMTAYQLPMDHPFVAITDADGKFEIADLPAGRHKFRIWHEKAGLLDKEYEIDVKGGDEPTEVEISYPAAKVAQLNGPQPKRVVLSRAD